MGNCKTTRVISPQCPRDRTSFPNHRAITSEKMSTLTDAEMQRQDTLIRFMTADHVVKGSLASSCLWYTRYLRSKFDLHWDQLAASLAGLEDYSIAPASGDLVTVYDFVLVVAKLFRSRQDLALVEIVDELANLNLLKPQLDEQRAIPNQIVFAALGWITMLYDAIPNPKGGKLEVTRTSTSSSGYRNPLVTRKYRNYKQGFDDIDQPLYILLGRFGDLIPEAGFLPFHNPEPRSPTESTDSIMVQLVCFHALHSIGGLRIEWVTSLNLHLELDSEKKTLKLYRFPSYCRMMAAERRNNVMSRFLAGHAARASEDVRIPGILTDQCFEEILISYRLIFGQDERSYKVFSSLLSSCGTSWDSDPMIPLLCGQSANDEQPRNIYDELNANEPASSYKPQTEFPFFGRRLLELQRFVQKHRARSGKLSGEQGDVFSRYSIWDTKILICLAIITLYVVVSLGLQYWQILLSKDQIRLATGNYQHNLPSFKVARG